MPSGPQSWGKERLWQPGRVRGHPTLARTCNSGMPRDPAQGHALGHQDVDTAQKGKLVCPALPSLCRSGLHQPCLQHLPQGRTSRWLQTLQNQPWGQPCPADPIPTLGLSGPLSWAGNSSQWHQPPNPGPLACSRQDGAEPHIHPHPLPPPGRARPGLTAKGPFSHQHTLTQPLLCPYRPRPGGPAEDKTDTLAGM